MTVEDFSRRHFMGKVVGCAIGAGAGFAASFPVAKETRVLRGADFPKQENLDNARAEKQEYQLILDFLDFEQNSKNRGARINEKAFKGYLDKEKELGDEATSSAVDCFKTLSGINTKEKELRSLLDVQIKNYDESIRILEDERKQHLEKQDLTVGNWGISAALSGIVGFVGWVIGARIDANRVVSDEKRAEQAMIDSRK